MPYKSLKGNAQLRAGALCTNYNAFTGQQSTLTLKKFVGYFARQLKDHPLSSITLEAMD